VDLLNRLNNFVFRAGLFGENFLRLTPMDAPDRARRGKPPRRLRCGARDRPEPVIPGRANGSALCAAPLAASRMTKFESPVSRQKLQRLLARRETAKLAIVGIMLGRLGRPEHHEFLAVLFDQRGELSLS
jgi:hypothetical protein